MKLSSKIYILLKSMEAGNSVKLGTGHRLVIGAGQTEPGLLVTRAGAKDSASPEMIGSEVAWLNLIRYARELTDAEAVAINKDLAMQKFKPSKFPTDDSYIRIQKVADDNV